MLIEAEWFLWFAKLVDNIEREGNMEEFKADGSKYSPYREKVHDFACTEAFGPKNPTKKGSTSPMELWLHLYSPRARKAEPTIPVPSERQSIN
jgi:hypothetical protein